MGGRGRPAAWLAAVACAGLGATAAAAREPRPYSLSYELSYGRRPSRATYLEDLDRTLGAWAASGGPLGAPTAVGEADLHLRLVFDQIVVERHYPDVSGEADVAFDPQNGGPTQTFSTLFEVQITVVDLRNESRVVVEKPLTVFNEQGFTKLIMDPQQRSWDVNVEFLLDRVDAFLHKQHKRIVAYLRGQGRPAPARDPAPR